MKNRLLGILFSLTLMLGMVAALSLLTYADDITEYDLWIGGTQVTSENPWGEGWRYDADSKILTLEHFAYEGGGHIADLDDGQTYSGAIWAGDDLTIVLKGGNDIKNTDSTDIGVVSDIVGTKSLTIDGDGELGLPGNGYTYGILAYNTDLAVNNCNITANSGATGIYLTNGDLVVDGSTIFSSAGDEGIKVCGDLIINGGEISCAGNGGEGLCVYGGLKINGGDVNSTSFNTKAIAADSFEMNGGKLVAYAPDNSYGLYVEVGSTVFNGGTALVSGDYGIYASNELYFNGGDITASGSSQGVFTEKRIVLSEKLAVSAGDDKTSAVDVTSTFVKDHDQKWVHIFKAPEPAPDDPTAVGTVHDVPGGFGMYVITSADTASLVKAPNRKSLTIPATVTISGKSFNVTGIQPAAFKGTTVKTLTVRTKWLTKASVRGSFKGSKVKTVKVKVGKKKENKKYVKKYRKIFKKNNSSKKVSVK